MQIAVAKGDFSVPLRDTARNVLKPYQVSNGEDLKLSSQRVSGVINTEGIYGGTKEVMGYLVEIEGQTVFVDELLLEVSK